jgi:hypothetical protein
LFTHLYHIIDESTLPGILDCCFEAVIAAAIEASVYFDSYQDLDGGGFINLQRKAVT